MDDGNLSDASKSKGYYSEGVSNVTFVIRYKVARLPFLQEDNLGASYFVSISSVTKRVVG